MKLGTRWFGIAVTLALGAGMTAMSQGCTFVTSDEPLDGGTFDGNPSPPIGSPDGAPQTNACNECLFQGCTGQWAVCQQSGECRAIYQCATQPACANDQSCVDQCYAAHPQGQSAYYALALCNRDRACSSCSAECSPQSGVCAPATQPDAGTPDTGTTVDAGAPDTGTTTDAGPVEDCAACTQSKCGTEKAACAPSTDCDAYSLCLAACTDATCVDKCDADHPQGKAASSALSTCMVNQCSTNCGL